MTTVGFGDYFPQTYLGKIVVVFACFYGIFIVSMTMVTLNSSKDYSCQEQNSFTICKRLLVRKRVEKEAAIIISLFFKVIKTKKKLRIDKYNMVHKRDVMYYEDVLDRYIDQFRFNRQQLRPDDVSLEEMIRGLIKRVEKDAYHIRVLINQQMSYSEQIDQIISSQEKTHTKLEDIHENFELMQDQIGKIQALIKKGNLNCQFKGNSQITAEEKTIQEAEKKTLIKIKVFQEDQQLKEFSQQQQQQQQQPLILVQQNSSQNKTFNIDLKKTSKIVEEDDEEEISEKNSNLIEEFKEHNGFENGVKESEKKMTIQQFLDENFDRNQVDDFFQTNQRRRNQFQDSSSSISELTYQRANVIQNNNHHHQQILSSSNLTQTQYEDYSSQSLTRPSKTPISGNKADFIEEKRYLPLKYLSAYINQQKEMEKQELLRKQQNENRQIRKINRLDFLMKQEQESMNDIVKRNQKQSVIQQQQNVRQLLSYKPKYIQDQQNKDNEQDEDMKGATLGSFITYFKNQQLQKDQQHQNMLQTYSHFEFEQTINNAQDNKKSNQQVNGRSTLNSFNKALKSILRENK